LAAHAILDASALVKRYADETGTPVVNHLFRRLPPARLACLNVGVLEVISILVRKRNANRISDAELQQALTNVHGEILGAPDFTKTAVTDSLIGRSISLVLRHSINATDALFLRTALDFAAELRAIGNDLILVASDLRLLRAAQAEGLKAFNPETQSESDLDALIGP